MVDALGPGAPPILAIGGPALAARGATLLADLRDFTAMGFSEAVPRARAIGRAWRRAHAAIEAGHLRGALLVGFSEFNTLLLGRLRRAGVPAVFYGPPQAWAWREGRARGIADRGDILCVLLPFEEPWWRARGAHVVYVGHPATETARIPAPMLRDAIGLTSGASAIAILPGSRPHEVRSLAVPMLDAFARVRADRASTDARVVVSASLDAGTATWLREEARRAGVATLDADPRAGAGEILGAFDVALTASGTASLEAALAGAVPVVAYKVGRLSEAVARALLQTRHIALPNIVLGRRVFAEHVQDDASPERLAESVIDAVDRRDPLREACAEVRHALGPARPSTHVAAVLQERM